jgi:choline-sulfatase
LPIQYLCCSHVRLSQAAPWTRTNYRHYLAAYYHFIGRLDEQVGQLLAGLQASDAADDTLIVFMADHGDGMTAHRMVTKQVSFYEETTGVPLVFAGGPITHRGGVLDNLVSTADLLPTLCDYAGLEPPARIYGRSFWPMLVNGHVDGNAREDVAAEWMTEWGDTIEPGRMLRTSGFKYTRYLEGEGEELYDLVADPGETRNLAGVPEYRSCLDEHRRRLAEHVRREQDPFFSLAWKAEPRWRSHAPGYPNHAGPCAPHYYRQQAEAAAKQGVGNA